MGVPLPGFVPAFEEHEARVAVGYSLAAWRRLPVSARALEVAHLRLRRLIHMHEEEAIARDLRRKGRR